MAGPTRVAGNIWLGGLGGGIRHTHDRGDRSPYLVKLLPEDLVVSKASVLPDNDDVPGGVEATSWADRRSRVVGETNIGRR